MPSVLILASSVTCGPAVQGKQHGGSVTHVTASKLTVAKSAVVVDLGTVTGCQNTPPPQGATPCKKATIGAGKSTKLFVNNAPVLLETLTGTTDGTPTGSLVVTANQTKLTSV